MDNHLPEQVFRLLRLLKGLNPRVELSLALLQKAFLNPLLDYGLCLANRKSSKPERIPTSSLLVNSVEPLTWTASLSGCIGIKLFMLRR